MCGRSVPSALDPARHAWSRANVALCSAPGDPTSAPILDQAPWYQMGWGLISPDNRMRVVNETLARQLWPNEDPLGKKVTIKPDAHLHHEQFDVMAV